MIDTEKIAIAFERNVKALTKRPSIGRSTGVSRARVTKGLVCEVEEGPWRLVADMPPQVGGEAAGPTPGVLGRAAFGSCLAIGYVMQLAAAGIDVAGVEVEVEADWDDGALFGTSDEPPGYLEVRYAVTIRSDAPQEQIERLLDVADARSAYHDIFSRPLSLKRSVEILSPTSA